MSRTFVLVCALYAVSLLIWCGWSLYGVHDAFAGGDFAILELYTLHASHGQWALGPYSRFGWYHPGPFFFYLLVPFYVASGYHPLGVTAGAVVVNVAAFTICAWTLCRHATGAMAVVVVGALAAYLWRVPVVVTSAWNPHVLLLPYAALIVSGAVVASGRLSLLPLVALVATFITQTHVGLAPAALAIATCALVAGVRAHRQPVPWKWLRITALVLFVSWLPPFYDQIQGTHNLGRLLTFFLEKSETPSSRETFAVWSGTLLQPLTTDFRAAWGGALPPMRRSLLMGTLALGEILLLLVAAAWMARRGRLVEAWLCRVCAIASIAAMVAISRIRGGLVDHLTFWNTMTGTLNVAVLLGVALTRVWEFVPVQRLPRWSRAAVPVTCLIALLGLAHEGLATLRQQRAELIERAPGSSHLERLYLTTRATIARARLHKPRIELRGPWSDVAGILVQLHKHDIPFGVERGSAWLYGAPLAESGDEDGAVTIGDTEQSATVAPNPDECLIAFARGTFVFVRVPTPEQFLKLRCASFESASH